jgi:hypothetical protein
MSISKILFKHSILKNYLFKKLNILTFDALTLHIFIKIYYLKFLKCIPKTLVSIVFAFDNYTYRKKFNCYELIGEESNTQPYEK